jgi:hypothetical protein
MSVPGNMLRQDMLRRVTENGDALSGQLATIGEHIAVLVGNSDSISTRLEDQLVACIDHTTAVHQTLQDILAQMRPGRGGGGGGGGGDGDDDADEEAGNWDSVTAALAKATQQCDLIRRNMREIRQRLVDEKKLLTGIKRTQDDLAGTTRTWLQSVRAYADEEAEFRRALATGLRPFYQPIDRAPPSDAATAAADGSSAATASAGGETHVDPPLLRMPWITQIPPWKPV